MAAPQDHGGKQVKSPAFKAAQWKPGQSGNPGGRPKGESLLAELHEVLEAKELLGKANPGGRTNRRLLAETAIMHAIKGRSAYFREIMERLYGKVMIRIEQKIEGGEDNGIDLPDHVVAAGLRAMLKASESKGEDGE